MISADGWFSWAERVRAHSTKIKGTSNPANGFIAHSAEGHEAYLRDNPPLTTGWGWHLSNLKSGVLLQHMPINAACFSSGHVTPNYNFVAMELEGLAGQAMTAAQLDTCVRVIRELSQARGWTPSRKMPRTLHEHKEWNQTACPSGRYPWDEILRRLEGAPIEEDEMYTPHVAIAHWFEGRSFDAATPDGQFWTMQAQADFGLPEPARGKDVQIAVYMDAGELKVFHGSTAAEAGSCGERDVRYTQMRAKLDANGTLNFRAEGPCRIGRIVSLGYYT